MAANRPDDDRPNEDGAGEGGAGEAGAGEGLRLGDALKLAGLVQTGGAAKQRIQAGEVRVNGQVETRRKRRLVPGDVIEVDGESFEIELDDG